MVKENITSVLLSLKPPFAFMIANGSKLVEFRRKFRIDLMPGTKIFLYSSSPVKAIVGECEITLVEKWPINKIEEIWNSGEGDVYSYFKDLNEGFVIFLNNAKLYDRAIKLEELRNLKIAPTLSYRFLDAIQTESVESLHVEKMILP